MHGRRQRLKGLVRVGVKRAAADAAGVDAVGNDHDSAQVAPAKTHAQLGQCLADAGGFGFGRGQRGARGRRENFAKTIDLDFMPARFPRGESRRRAG